MKKILCTLCIAAAFVSCNLDEFPLDKLAPENYFNNEEELKTFTNTFYQQNFPEAGAIYSESADVIIVTTLQSEVSGTRTVVNEGGGWDTGSWQPLTYINNYLYYSHRCSDTKARERYDGVARFFRAYFYFEKVKRFGDVPWYDQPLKSDNPDLYKARDYEIGLNIIHNANNYTLSNTYGMPGLNKKIVDSYLKSDGSRFTDVPGYSTMEFYQEMQGRDPRLTQTVRGPGYTRIGQTARLSPDFSCSTTGYQLTKWVTDVSQDGYNKSYNDIILFRAAEVYLNFAEAKAERGTLTQDDINKSIKPIRDRVGMPNLDMKAANANPDPYLASNVTGYPNVSGENKGVILEIRRERTIELIAEGHRYYDMVRWKEGKMFEQEFKGMYFTPGMNSDGYRIYDLDGSGDISELDVCLYTTSSAPKAADHPELAVIKTFLKIGSAFELTGAAGGNIIVHNTKTEPREWREDRDYLYPLPLSQIQFAPDKIKQNPNW